MTAAGTSLLAVLAGRLVVGDNVSIDDDDIEAPGGRDGGEYGLKETRNFENSLFGGRPIHREGD